MEDLLAKFGKQRWAPYLCIGTALVLVVLLGLCGAYLELERARASVTSSIVGRLRSHAERTAGHLENLGAESGTGADLATARNAQWLRAHWRRVIPQPERVYGAVIDDDGHIVAHSDPTLEGGHLPTKWFDRELTAAGPGVVETSCRELTGGVRSFDIQAPISVGGEKLGTYHSGLNAAWFENEVASAEATVLRRWFLVTGAIVSVVSVAVFALLAIMRRNATLRRQLDRAELQRVTAINRLITGLAHEIRNPLNAIKLNLFSVNRRLTRSAGPQDQTATHMIEASALEVGRVEELMRELLGYVRNEPQVDELVDLVTEVRDAVTFYQPLLTEDQIHLHAELPDEAIEVRLNRQRLRQVLLNLLTNSREALGEEGQIWIRIRRQEESAEVVIEDDGPGIPTRDQDKVFEPFFSTKSAGVGLGLTLVRNYVTQFGGDVQCIRSAKRGTCIRISIPLAETATLARGVT
ncbi:MAG TPA: HAMP domain-containing sensor histidine kinase [Pirellulales bacterium]|nr:HAMP domain-containing sensor histidine kinase [Pirellulales bacterium]